MSKPAVTVVRNLLKAHVEESLRGTRLKKEEHILIYYSVIY